MLLRLSRLAFWLAAAAAAWGLIAPRGHETLLTALAGIASVFAFLLWRSGVRSETENARLTPAVVVEPLPRDALADAAAMITRAVQAAASLEAGLHAAARILRSELGAREVSVVKVLGLTANHARVSTLIEFQPGFLTVERSVRLDSVPLGTAIATQREAGATPGVIALPVLEAGEVVAALELGGIQLAFEAAALGELLETAQRELSDCAMVYRDGPSPPSDTQFDIGSNQRDTLPLADAERTHEKRVDDHKPSPPAPPAGPFDMLNTPVLDAAALARLTELDPTGANHLMERVLQAFQTSVARLRPQADAACQSGDQAAFKLVAHTLKSSSASIGALRLSRLCAQIEAMIREGTLTDMAPYHEQLSGALDEALVAIDAMLEARK